MNLDNIDNSAAQMFQAESRHWSPDPEVEQAEADYIWAVCARLTAEHDAENCPDDRLGPALVLVEGATDTQAMALDALHDAASPSAADIRVLNDRAISEWLAGRGVRGEA